MNPARIAVKTGLKSILSSLIVSLVSDINPVYPVDPVKKLLVTFALFTCHALRLCRSLKSLSKDQIKRQPAVTADTNVLSVLSFSKKHTFGVLLCDQQNLIDLSKRF